MRSSDTSLPAKCCFIGLGHVCCFLAAWWLLLMCVPIESCVNQEWARRARCGRPPPKTSTQNEHNIIVAAAMAAEIGSRSLHSLNLASSSSGLFISWITKRPRASTPSLHFVVRLDTTFQYHCRKLEWPREGASRIIVFVASNFAAHCAAPPPSLLQFYLQVPSKTLAVIYHPTDPSLTFSVH